MLPFCWERIRVRRVIVRSQSGGLVGVDVCRPPNPSISRECMFGARFKSQRRLPSGRSVRRSRRDHRGAGGSRTCRYGSVEGLPVWPNRDPIGEEAGLNLYAFVQNGPTVDIDPHGQSIIGFILLGRAAWLGACGVWAASKGVEAFPGDDKKQHCMISCLHNRCSGLGTPLFTLAGGVLWELIHGQYEGDDILADAYGTAASYNIFRSCQALCNDCPY